MNGVISDRWIFDDKAAQDAVDFFPLLLNHVKGRRGAFELAEWQADIIRDIFGWKDRDTGFRRYRQVYCEVPRKSGKTSLAAGVLLYMLLVDGEVGAEVYSAATTREQAGLVYDIAAKMVSANETLSSRCKRLDSKKRLVAGDSFFQACSSEAGAVHGTNPHCVIFDELHEQPDRRLWESFETGFGARDQPLFFSITTAGHDRSTICWEQHEYARAVKDDPTIDEQFLAVLYAADPGDDWTSPATWKKANPNYGVSVKPDFLRKECDKAQQIPAFQNAFRRLYLNQWTEQESRIISMEEWDACCTDWDWDPKDFHGRVCYAGLDLASTRDVTALTLVFPEDDGGASVMPWMWIPEDNVDDRSRQDQRMLRNFAARGRLELTSGNHVDVAELTDRIYDICQDYDWQYMGYDPWNADAVVQPLQARGFPGDRMILMPQGVRTYNEPIKTLLAWLGSKLLRHDGNEVLRWMASNVAVKIDVRGNYTLDKGKSGDKIDGISAMCMGIALQLHYHTSDVNSAAGMYVL